MYVIFSVILFICYLNIISDSEEAMTMAMTSLVQSLVDEEHPITAASIDTIDIFNVVEDIKGLL